MVLTSTVFVTTILVHAGRSASSNEVVMGLNAPKTQPEQESDVVLVGWTTDVGRTKEGGVMLFCDVVSAYEIVTEVGTAVE